MGISHDSLCAFHMTAIDFPWYRVSTRSCGLALQTTKEVDGGDSETVKEQAREEGCSLESRFHAARSFEQQFS